MRYSVIANPKSLQGYRNSQQNDTGHPPTGQVLNGWHLPTIAHQFVRSAQSLVARRGRPKTKAPREGRLVVTN
jgi:hypothetical protein